MEAVLDSADGSSVFTVKDSGNVKMTDIDSDGNIVAKGCVRLDAGGTECTTAEQLMVDGAIGIGVTSITGALQVSGDEARFGAAGTVDYATGSGDVYVQSNLEVDGTIYGNISGSANSLAYDRLTNPAGNSGLNFSSFTNTWTSGLTTSADFFTISSTANFIGGASLLRLAQSGAPTGGSMLEISNPAAAVNHITADNFIVSQTGGVTMSGNMLANGGSATHIWTGGVTSGDYFTISNSGNFTSGSVLKLSQGGVPSGGAMLSIGNTAAGVNHIAANNFTLSQSGGIVTSGAATMGGDLTVSGDDIYMNTNTTGAVLVADGTNFNPVVMGGDCTISSAGAMTCTAGAASSIRYDQIIAPANNSGINFGAFNNAWTSSTGTHLWTSTGNTSGNYFTIANAGALTSGGAVLRLNQLPGAATGGSVISIENYDTDVTTISAPNFTVAQPGHVTMGGDLTVRGDDLYMTTNTSGAVLVADGTNFNPVVMSGDCSISSTGVITCNAASALTADSVVPYSKVGPPVTSHGINFGAFNNTWTSSTGTHLWTGASVTGDYFTLASSGSRTAGSLLKLNQNAGSVGGSVLSIENSSTGVVSISAPNFTVTQPGNVTANNTTLSGDLTVSGDDLYMTTNTSGAVLVADGTNFNPVVMSGDCSISSAGAITCNAASALTAGSVIPFNKVGPTQTSHGIDFGAFNSTWTSTTGKHIWTSGGTGGDYFTISNSGAFDGSSSVLRLSATGASSGGAVLGITNVDTDVNSITAPNFVVKQSGNVGIGTTAPTEKLQVMSGMAVGVPNSGNWDSTYNYIKIGDIGSIAGLVSSDGSGGVVINRNAYYNGGWKEINNGQNNMQIELIPNSIRFGYADATGIGSPVSYTYPFNFNLYTGTATITGNVGIGTTSPSTKLHVVGGTTVIGTTENNVWTSTTGTNLWSGANTNTNFFTIANSGVLASGGAVLRLNQNNNATGGSVISIENYDTDVTTISAPNFTVAQPGHVTMGGDLTVRGDDLYMTTNTTGAVLVADGTNFNPVVMSGDCTISSTGAMTCAPSGGLTTSSVIPFNKVGPTQTSHGIDFGAFNSTWTSTTGKHIWTSGGTGGDYFTISNSGAFDGSSSVLRLSATGASSGGAVLGITNVDTDVNSITAPNFVVTQGGNVGIGTTSPASKLEVTGNIELTVPAAGSSRRIGTPNAVRTGASGGSAIEFAREAADGSDIIKFITHSAGVSTDERVRIDKSGNVGIGTTAPDAKLHVVGAGGSSAGSRVGFFTDNNPQVGANLTIGYTGEGADEKYKSIVVDSNGLNFGKMTDALNAIPTIQMTISHAGNIGIGTATPSAKLHVLGGTLVVNTTESNIWTSTTGTNLWSGANTSTNFFTIANSGVLASGGAVLRLNQGASVNPTGGSILSIENYDTDVTTISAPNFTVAQPGHVTMGGDLTVSGDDLYMTTNTSGAVLVADGTNFNPVVMSGDCTISSTGVISCNAASALTASSVIPYNKIGPPATSHGINFGAFDNTWTSTSGNRAWVSTTGNNVWTSTTGKHIWTSGVTGGDYFTISNSGAFDGSSSVLRLSATGASSGGAVLGITNVDTDVNSITAPNFVVTQGGNVGIGRQPQGYQLDVTDSIRIGTENTFGTRIQFNNGFNISTFGGGGIALGGSAYTRITNDGGSTGALFSQGYALAPGLQMRPMATDQIGLEVYRTTDGQTADLFQVSTVAGTQTGNLFKVTAAGNVGIGTTSPAAKLHVVGGMRMVNTTENNIWTSTTGTNLWTGANATENFFTIANTGVLASGGALLRLNQGASVNPTGGSIISIENTDTDVTTISAPNFTVAQQGNVTANNTTLSGDLTVSGDDLYMTTNTSGAVLVADGTNFNPVVMSGDCTISSTGVISCNAASALTADSVILFNKIGTPATSHGINFGDKNSTWTSTTGKHIWTSGGTGGDYFTISNSGAFDGSSSVLRLSATGASSGGAVLGITNIDTDVNSIAAPNFVVKQSGNVGIGTTAPLAKLSIHNPNPSVTNPHMRFSLSADSSQDTIVWSTADANFYTNGNIVATYGFGIRGQGSNVLGIDGNSSDMHMAFRTNSAEAMRIIQGGNVGIGTTAPGAKLEIVGGTIVNSTTNNNIWTSTTGTNLWSGANTSTNFFTIANTGVLASGGAVLRLNQGASVNPTGGSIISIENYDTDVTTISAPNFTVAQQGNVTANNTTLSGDLTVSGDDLYMTTNTSGAVLVADGTNFNPVVMSGDCSISSAGVITCNAASALTAGSVIPYNKIGPPATSHGINFGAFDNTWTSTSGNRAWVSTTGNNVWTSTTGTHLWTGANTSGDYFTIANSGARTAGSVLKLFQGGSSANTGGSVLEIANQDTDVNSITAPNFVVKQGGNVSIGTTGINYTTSSPQAIVGNRVNVSHIVLVSAGSTQLGGFGGNLIGAFGSNDTSSSLLISADYNQPLVFGRFINGYTSYTESARFDSNGNLGIGTTNPQNTLHVYSASEHGMVRIETAAADGNNAAVQLVGPSSNWYMLTNRSGLAGAASTLAFYGGTSASSKMVIDASGNVGIGTTAPGAKLEIVGGTIVKSTTNNNVWTSTTGTNLWSGANTNTNFFTIANEGVLASGGAVLRLNQGASVNPTGGSILSIENYDTDVTTISAPNFTVAQPGHVTMGGDLTVSGDDLYMATNTSGAVLVADGTNFNPVVMSGDCTISSAGVISCNAASALTASSVIPYNKIGPPATSHGINFGAFDNTWTSTSGNRAWVSTTGNNVWTSTTGKHIWTSGGTGGDYFTISNSGAFDGSSSVLRLSATGASSGGAVLAITNVDTDVNSITAPNFVVTQSGNVGIGTTSPNTKLAIVGSNVSAPILNVESSIGPGQGINLAEFKNNTGNKLTISDLGDITAAGTILTLSGSNARATLAGNWRVGDNSSNFVIQDTQMSQNVFEIEKNGVAGSLYIKNTGNVGIGTTAPGAKLEVIGGTRVSSTTNNNIWTSTTGTNLWSGANTNTNFFTIANTGVLASGGAVLRLNQGASVNPTGGSILSIENYDTDVTTISAPNFTVAQPGHVTMGGDLTVSGDDLYMATNTSGAVLVADGTNFNPVVMSGDCTISSAGVISCNAASALTASSVIPYNKIGPPATSHGINFGAFDNTWTSTSGNRAWVSTTGNNVWTSTTGTHLWTGANTSGDYFTIANSGVRTAGSVLKLFQGGSSANTGGSVLEIANQDTDVNSITAPNFVVKQNGDVGIGTAAPGAKLDVNGNIVVDASNAVLGLSNGNGTLYSSIGFNNSTNNFEIKQIHTNGSMIFYTGTGPAAQMTIQSNGNVGIGTTGPNNKLEVNGNARVTNLVIGTDTNNGNPIRVVSNVASQVSVEAVSGNTDAMINLQPSGTGKAALYVSGTQDFTIYGNGTSNPVLTVQNGGNVGIGTATPSAKLHVLGGTLVVNTTENNIWTSSTGTNLWSGANTSTNFFTIANTGVLAAGGAVLRLNQGASVNPTGGSILSIENYDTDVTTISAPNFTVAQQGNVTMGGDLTVSGDDLYMATNTSGAVLVADGTNFNPVVMSGDCTISSTGVISCNAASALTASSVIPYNKIGPPVTAHGINFGAFDNTWTSTTGNRAWVSTTGNNVWTSTTGTHLWTGGGTGGDYFTISNSGAFDGSSSVLRLSATGASSGGAVLGITNVDTDVNSIVAPNFVVKQSGNVGIGTTDPSTNTLQFADGAKVGGPQGQWQLNDSGNGTLDIIPSSNTAVTNAGIQLKSSNETNTWNSYFANANGNGSIGFKLNMTGGTAVAGDRILDIQDAGTTRFTVTTPGNVGIGTAAPGAKLEVIGGVKVASTTNDNIWTSSTGTNLWSGANTSTNFFTIANTGVLASGGALLRLNQGASVNPTGGSILSIENYDTDVTTISAPNFTVAQPGHVTMGGDLTVRGDDLYMTTNTSGAVLVADGTNFNPVVMSGDCSISSAGVITCNAASALTAGSVIPFNKVGPTQTSHGIDFGAYNSTWTSTTGKHIWTSGGTGGDYFTISNSGAFDGSSSVLRLSATGASSGGAVLGITNVDTDVNSITAPNFVVTQSGNVGIGTTTPSTKLEVVSSQIKISGREDNWNTVAGIEFNDTLPSSSARRWAILNAAEVEGSLAFRVGTSQTGNPWINGSTKMAIDSAGIVGIGETSPGVTSPGSKLHVSADDAAIATPTVNNLVTFSNTSDASDITRVAIVAGASGYSVLDFGDTALDNVGGITYNHTDNSMSFTTNNTNDRMVINSAGNVGIGTAGPGAKLDLRDGKLILTDADVAHGITGFNPTAAYGSLSIDDSTGGGLAIVGISDTNNVNGLTLTGLISADPQSNIPAVTISGGKGNGTGQDALDAGQTVLQIQNQYRGTALMSILGSGNVGIGTTGPGQLLHIKGNAAKIAIQDDTSGIASLIGVDSNGDAILQFYDSGSNEDIRLYAANGANSWINNGGNVGIGTTSPSAKLHVLGGTLVVNTTENNIWTSTTGTNLWSGANTSTNFFTIANTGVLASGGAVLRLNQNNNATGGSVISIENYDTDVTTISAPNFTVAQQGNVTANNATLSGDLTVSGDDLYMATNTSGAVLVADGTNFNPVVMSGDCSISSAGVITCNAASALTAGSVIPFNKVGPPVTAHGINLGTFDATWTSTTGNSLWQSTTGNRAWVSTTGNNVWTSGTGTNLWTGANTTGDYFTIANSGARTAGSVLKLFQGGSSANTGGSVLEIANQDTDVNSITAPNFVVTQSGNVGIGTTGPSTNLHVSGTTGITLTGTDAFGNTIFDMVNSVIGNTWRIQSDGNGDLRFQNSGTIQLLMQRVSGAVMVGSDTTANTKLGVVGTTTTYPVAIFKGAAGQTADLQQWTNSSGTVLAEVTATGNVGIGTTTPSTKLEVIGGVKVASTTNDNIWTSSTGTNLWSGANTSTNFFTIANTGVLASGGAVLRLNQGASVNPTGGSIISIENYDTDVTTISAPNFTVAQQGNVTANNITATHTTLSGDLTVSGDDLYMTTNTSGAVLVADGTNFNPVVMSGDCSISSTGAMTCAPSGGLTTSSVIPFNKVGPTQTSHGIDFGALNSTWTSTTGKHIWTSGGTGGDYFTISNSGAFDGSSSVLRLSATGASSGGAVLGITNVDTDVNSIVAPNFVVKKNGSVGIQDSSPVTQLSLVGDFNMQRYGTPVFPHNLIADSQSLYTYVDDDYVNFISEQDENAGYFGSFRFVMDNDGTGTPVFVISNKSAHTVPLFRVHSNGKVGIGTTGDPTSPLHVVGGTLTVNTNENNVWRNTTGNNVWTSTTGTNLWTGANTSTNFFTIANTGVLASGGALLRLNQGKSVNPTGGSIISIENYDTDVTTISAPNFTVAQPGHVTMGGDLTVSGDDLYMATNTSGAVLVADGTNFNPVVMSGDCSISSAGVITCNAASALTAGSVIPFNKIGPTQTSHGIDFGAYNSTWTSTTGKHVWTSGGTGGDFFTISNSGAFDGSSSVLRLSATGASSGGAVLGITNVDTDVNSITAPNFVVKQNGNVGIGTTAPQTKLTVSGGDIAVYSEGTTQQRQIAVRSNDFDTTSQATIIRYIDSGVAGNFIDAIPNADAGVLAFQNSSNALIGTNGGTPLIFYTLSAERMRIDYRGNVGIGTTAPTSPLHVVGGTLTVNTNENNVWRNTTGNNVWTSTTGTNLWTGANTSGDYFTIANSGARTAGAVLKLFQGGSSANTGGSVLEIANQDTDVTSISAPNFVVKQNGDVGIGTTSPLSLLHLSAAAQSALMMSDTRTAGNQNGRLVYDGGTSVNGGGWVFQKMTDAGAFSSNLVSIVQNTGNVGIGTITPAAKLQVMGGFQVTNTTENNIWTSTTGTNLWTGANTSTHYFTIANTGVLASGGALLRLNQGKSAGVNPTGGSIISIENTDTDVTTISAPNFTVEQNGQVYIGGSRAASHSTDFHTLIVGDRPDQAGVAGILLNPTNNSSVGTNAGMGISYNDSLGYMSLNSWGITSAPTRLAIERLSGKVGIGTTNPSAKLQVMGGFQVTNTTENNIWTSTTGTNLWTGANTSTHYFTIANTGVLASGGALLRLNQGKSVNPTGGSIISIENYDTDVTTISAPNFTVTQSGRVGIGVSSPAVSLDILSADNSTGQQIKINAAQSECTVLDTFIDFRSTTGSEGSIGCTASAGVLAYNTFTGSHYTILEEKQDAGVLMLLCSTGEVIDRFQSGDASPKEQLTKSRVCRERRSQAAVGVYGGTDKEGRAMVLSIGTGKMIVANKGENLKVGDYLMSSDIPGRVEKQDDDIYHNYTVGKAMENIEWKERENERIIAVIYEGG